MNLQYNSIKYATLLKNRGLKSSTANALISTLSEIDFFNIISKQEVYNMLNEAIEKVFIKHDKIMSDMLKKEDLKIAAQRREFAAQRREFQASMRDMAKSNEKKILEQRAEFQEQLKEQRKELLDSRRWVVGTIITVGVSLAAYLSALIHFK